MSYEKQTWIDKNEDEGIAGTPCDAEHFNHMEEGISENSDAVEALNNDLTDNYRWKTYHTLSSIGLSAPITTLEIINYLKENSMRYVMVILSGGTSTFTDIPGGDGLLRIMAGNITSGRYIGIEFIRTNASTGPILYMAQVNSAWDTLTWYQMSSGTVVTSLNALSDDVEPI